MFNSLNSSSVRAIIKEKFEIIRTNFFFEFLLKRQGECPMHYSKFLCNRLSMEIQMNDIGLLKIFLFGYF